jgi:hypothetical protein
MVTCKICDRTTELPTENGWTYRFEYKRTAIDRHKLRSYPIGWHCQVCTEALNRIGFKDIMKMGHFVGRTLQ